MGHLEAHPDPARIRFLHAVGQSTLRQGITVPISAQTEWARQIEKGQAIPITIFFGEQHVDAVLRRINNVAGHLQIRYEGKGRVPLREYLRNEFLGSDQDLRGPLEIVESGDRSFTFRPLAGDKSLPPALAVVNPIFRNVAPHEAQRLSEYKSLQSALRTIRYQPDDGQREYNARIASVLLEQGWKKEVRVLDALGLRVDFERNGVWVEVEFGNARVYYQDYVKFILAHRYRGATCGILLCPTEAFAHLLCELGKKRAVGRQRLKSPRSPSYSGMMTYEKAARELPHLEFLFAGRLVVAGIQLSRSVATST